MVMLPSLAPTRFIGATPLLSMGRGRATPSTIEPAPGPLSAPEPVVVERTTPRLAAIDARLAD